MEYQDLRDLIQSSEEMGKLKTLKNCDWNLEISAITELVHHKEDGPAVLFDEIKGYPKGYRVLANSLASRKRLALTLGLPAGETKMDFVRIWQENYKKIKPSPAKFVKQSQLFENVYKDGDAGDEYGGALRRAGRCIDGRHPGRTVRNDGRGVLWSADSGKCGNRRRRRRSFR